MFGPGRHFPPAELREWERGERLDSEYQLSAEPPSPAQPCRSPHPHPKVGVHFYKGRTGEEGGEASWEVGARRREEGKPRGANGPGIGQERHPRLSSQLILMGYLCLGHVNALPIKFHTAKVVQSWMFPLTGIGRSTKLLQ